MYSDTISHRKTMGDVDVLWHDGVYHLFHLVLPNHDFIAHATSTDGINWKRIENALFIGHPGSWDDHMLWTMHVTPDPFVAGRWRMFYTGLSRSDRGDIQRIGLAVSDDLRSWHKVADRWESVAGPRVDGSEGVSSRFDPESHFPLCAEPPYYEYSLYEGREWVSWRDPFYFRENGRGFLLLSGRVPYGPVIRRGCVAMLEEVGPQQFELRGSLHHPGLYDDVEVPNLIRLDGRYYLIGSIREDAKVRYWCADRPEGPWRNYFDNVLLPQGNYAARISSDDRGPLVWNFFTADSSQRMVLNLMPPPKRLEVEEDGRLRIRSFEGFAVDGPPIERAADLLPLEPFIGNRHAHWTHEPDSDSLVLEAEGGFEGFLFREPVGCFRFSAKLYLDGFGKCGFLFRTNPTTSDGYHLSLDLIKGVAQLRAWGERPGGRSEEAFRFETLQSGYFSSDPRSPWEIRLLAWSSYLEFSIGGRVLLTLADETYAAGRFGCYVESARLRLDHVRLEHLRSPVRPTDQLPNG